MRRGVAIAAGALLVAAGIAAFFIWRGASAKGPSSLRVLLVGWDGADWDVVEPMIEAGELPNLARLRERGAWGPLRTVEPILSPVVWTSLATGTRPEKHGITWFMADTDRPDRRVPVTSRLRQRKAFWNVLSEADRSVGVIGWWASYPAEEVRGFVVTDFVGYHGFGVTGRGVRLDVGKTYPLDLAAEVEEAIPDPQRLPFEEASRFVEVSAEEYGSLGTAEQGPFGESLRQFRTHVATARGYTALARSLTERFRPETLAVYYEMSDAAAHLFMRFASPKGTKVSEEGFERFRGTVAAVYREQDRMLGELLEICGPETTVLVVSDHGFKTGEERPEEGDEVEVGKAHLWHEAEGIFVAAGPAVRRGARLERASILDVFPTMLRLLDLPVASDLDGSVLVDLFNPEWLARNRPKRVDSFEARAEGAVVAEAEAFGQEVEERLKALGYVGGGGLGSAEIHFARAGLWLERGDMGKAEEELRKALQLRPEEPGIRMNLAGIYLRTDRPHLARREFERVLVARPDALLALLTLADIEKEAGNLGAARALLERALSVREDVAPTHVALGDCLYRMGAVEEAEVAFRRALELDLATPAAHYNLGVLLQGKGLFEEAEREYETALAFAPDLAPAILNWSDLLARRGEKELAISLLERAVAGAPEAADLRYNLGTLLVEAGEHGRAVSHLEAVIEKKPEFAEARHNLGIAYLGAGDEAKARRQFEILVGWNPADAEAWLNLARVDAVSGRDEEAAKGLRRALEAGGDRIREAAAADAVFSRVLEASLAPETRPAGATGR